MSHKAASFLVLLLVRLQFVINILSNLCVCEQPIRRQNLFVRWLLNGVIETICWVSWKQRPQRPLRPLRPPKTPKLENKDPPYFSGLRNYRQSVAKTTVSWALVTRILASRTDIRGNGFVLNRKTLCFDSSKVLTPCLFEVFNFHRK